MSQPIIRFVGATKIFHTANGEVRAVDGVSFEVERGEVFGVIGYSGAGKSTLVRLVNALEKADAGEVWVNGENVARLGQAGLRKTRANIGMIFQQFNLFSAKTVAQNVGYPLKLAGQSKDERATRVAELLEFVGLADRGKAYPSQLSGGQKQRVGIARALASNPSIILADEATSALDPETTRDVLDLLRRANARFGITIMLITHEMSVVQYLCDRVAVMEAGKVVELGSTYDLFAHPNAHVTERFVRTALHDRPFAESLERLRMGHPGTLVSVGVGDASASGLDLSAALAGTSVQASIVFGSIVEISARPFGSVLVELTGDGAAVDGVVATLRLAHEVTDLGSAADPHVDPAWLRGGDAVRDVSPAAQGGVAPSAAAENAPSVESELAS